MKTIELNWKETTTCTFCTHLDKEDFDKKKGRNEALDIRRKKISDSCELPHKL